MLTAGMLVGMACRKERQEDLVAPPEVARDHFGAGFDIVQDRAVVLLHPARRTAGAAGVDDAGEVPTGDCRGALPELVDRRVAHNQPAPMVELHVVRSLAG